MTPAAGTDADGPRSAGPRTAARYGARCASPGPSPGQTPATDWIQERYAVTLVYAVVV